MNIKILTLFPEVYDALKTSVIGRAYDNGLFGMDIYNIRDYSKDKHKKTDDYPFGGGAGMVMTPQPIHTAINEVDKNHEYKRIYLSPKGVKFSQSIARELAKEPKLLFLSGAYEGIDERVIQLDIDLELSIGDYVITSGDLAAMVVINAVLRNIKGVLGKEESAAEESFSDNYLEYPHYTRPQEFCSLSVPEVLLSGNHQKIEEWRRQKQLEITQARRKDLLKR